MKGIRYVEARPSSPEREVDYHRWYNEGHMAEVLGVPGVVAARRYASVRQDGGPFVAIYELEADDSGKSSER